MAEFVFVEKDKYKVVGILTDEDIKKINSFKTKLVFFSSFLAKYVKNKDVITYITQKIIHLYHNPSVTLTPAAIDAVPIVKGLVIAVVKPTPEAINIREIAVKLDQLRTVHSIAKTGYKISNCSCKPNTADKIIITAVIAQMAIKRLDFSFIIITLTNETSPPLFSNTLKVPPSTNNKAIIIIILALLLPNNNASIGEVNQR